MTKKVLVTGATGNIGSLIVPQLLEAGADVRVLVRNPEKAKELKSKGVETFIGDFSNQEILERACEGVDSILAITPPGPDAVTHGEVIVQAALKSGSPQYVRISALGAAEDAPTENGKLHYASDQQVVNSGLSYTILRPHFFMQNIFMSVDTIKSDGNMYWGMGDGSLGMIDVRDIVDCAVEILVNGGHSNKIYTLTGDKSISFNDAAATISKAVGKEVKYIPVSLEAVGEAVRQIWSDWGATVMMQYSRAYSEGWGDFITNDVEEITGKKPRNFRQFADEILKWAL